MCAIKALYLANGLPFAEALETMMQANNTELLASFVYEFLMDFEDMKFDLNDTEGIMED